MIKILYIHYLCTIFYNFFSISKSNIKSYFSFYLSLKEGNS